MNKYEIGQRIDVVVERVLPFGVFARSDDGIPAYIRRRELDLDMDAEPGIIVREGDHVIATVISQSGHGKHMELSRRATLPDPWPDFARHFGEGSMVRGTVRVLRPRGVFLRIQAGINGFVPLSELSTWTVGKPEELLWVGDEVEAVITHLDMRSKKLVLSIKERIEGRERAVSMVERMDAKAKAQSTVENLSEPSRPEFETLARDQAQRIGKVIVVDDNDEVRNGLVNWLAPRGYDVVGARTIPEAEYLIQDVNEGVIFLDLDLSGKDGLGLARDLHTRDGSMHVCIASDPESLADRASQIQALGVMQVFAKPLNLDEVDHFLSRLGRGEAVPLQWNPVLRPIRSDADSFGRPKDSLPQRHSPIHRLQTALAKLVETMQAEKGIVFEINASSRSVLIIVEAGTLPLNYDARYELDDSPVRDVIANNNIVTESNATRSKRFRKLMSLVNFESCIGVPIETMDGIHRGVFFFHRQRDVFGVQHQHGGKMGSMWLSAILEQQMLDQRMFASSALWLSGELAASFAHEASNKISAIELQHRSLLRIPDLPEKYLTTLLPLQQSINELKALAESFQVVIHSKDKLITFDVNDTMRRAEMLMRAQARKEQARIVMHFGNNLPPTMCSQAALQQVFLHVMVNAIQQMASKQGGRRVLEITTSFEKQSLFPIKIRFCDSGPGIHVQLWERIFDLGFSTRGGTGLGLYIARSLIDSFGGRIAVEESLIPIGTTFLIELPEARQGGEV